jgi:hypothetical protein
MPEFIENPRRTPRVAVRCEARIAVRDGGFWASPTSDYGPRGCQVLAPVRLEPGSRLFLELANERIPAPAVLAGYVAWTARQAPWRTGIAFDGGSAAAAGGFFDQLTAAFPGIDTYGQAPGRIPADATLAPRPPPPLRPQLSEEEASLLAALGPGLRADALRAKLGYAWGRGYALFSLLGRRYVAIGEPAPAAAAAWTELVARPVPAGRPAGLDLAASSSS